MSKQKKVITIKLPPDLGNKDVSLAYHDSHTHLQLMRAILKRRKGIQVSAEDFNLSYNKDPDEAGYDNHTKMRDTTDGTKAKIIMYMHLIPPPPPPPPEILVDSCDDEPTQPAPSGKTCPECGAQGQKKKFCGQCGQRLNSQDTKPLADKNKLRQDRANTTKQERAKTIYNKNPPSGNVCANCNEGISGNHYNISGNMYHKSCFVCSKCGKSIAGKQFSLKNNKLYCEKDYHELFGARCAACCEVIKDRILIALDAKWHFKCFTCCHCLKPLEGTQFYVEDNNVYCPTDHQQLFAVRCHACEKVIEGQYVHVTSLEQKFHPDCLVCFSCKTPLCGKKFYCDDNSDEIYCAEHYLEHATVCARCGQFVTSSVLHVGDKNYHQACYQRIEEEKHRREKRERREREEKRKREQMRRKQMTNPIRASPIITSHPKPNLQPLKVSVPVDEEIDKTIPGPPVDDPPEKGKSPGKIKKRTDFVAEQIQTPTRSRSVLGAKRPKKKVPTPSSTSSQNSESKLSISLVPDSSLDSPRDSLSSTYNDSISTSASFTGAQLYPDDDDKSDSDDESKRMANSPGLGSKKGSFSRIRGPSNLIPNRLTSKTFSLAGRKGSTSGKEEVVGYVKYKDLIDGEALIPYVKNGINECLKQTFSSLNCRPDYRKKDLYRLELDEIIYNFLDYAPRVFYSLRKRFGINQNLYIQSLINDGINGGKLGAGKSGMLFFFSNDKRFILKTITRAELKFFRKILRQYYGHMLRNPHSLLPRFFGMYKITMPEQKPLRLIVMNNLFKTPLKLHEKYDLKGSTRNRYVDISKEKKSSGGVLKDLNFNNRNHKLWVGKEQRDAIIRQMRLDTEFLMDMGIMDQSLLLGLHIGEEGDTTPKTGHKISLKSMKGQLVKTDKDADDLFSCFQNEVGGLRSWKDGNFGKDVYFFGIIDILQMFNLKKKVESAYKGTRYNKKAISAVSSRMYGERFLEYMESHII